MQHTKLFLLMAFLGLPSHIIDCWEMPFTQIGTQIRLLAAPEGPISIENSIATLCGHPMNLAQSYDFTPSNSEHAVSRDKQKKSLEELLQEQPQVFFSGRLRHNNKEICRHTATLRTPNRFSWLGFFALYKNSLNTVMIIPFKQEDNVFYFGKICKLFNESGFPQSPQSHLENVLDIVLPVKIPAIQLAIPRVAITHEKQTEDQTEETDSKTKVAEAAQEASAAAVEPVGIARAVKTPEPTIIEATLPSPSDQQPQLTEDSTNSVPSKTFAEVAATQLPAQETSPELMATETAKVVLCTEPTIPALKITPAETHKKKSKKRSDNTPASDDFRIVAHGAPARKALPTESTFQILYTNPSKEAVVATKAAEEVKVVSLTSVGAVAADTSKKTKKTGKKTKKTDAAAMDDEAVLAAEQLKSQFEREKRLFKVYDIGTFLVNVVTEKIGSHLLSSTNIEDKVTLLGKDIITCSSLYKPTVEYQEIIEPYKEYLTAVLGYLLFKNVLKLGFIKTNFKDFLCNTDFNTISMISDNFKNPEKPLSTGSPMPASIHTESPEDKKQQLLRAVPGTLPHQEVCTLLQGCSGIITKEELPALLGHVRFSEENTPDKIMLRDEMQKLSKKLYVQGYVTRRSVAALQEFCTFYKEQIASADSKTTHLESVIALRRAIRSDESISLSDTLDRVLNQFAEESAEPTDLPYALEKNILLAFCKIQKSESTDECIANITTIGRNLIKSGNIDTFEAIWNNTCLLFAQDLPIETTRPLLRSLAESFYHNLAQQKDNPRAQELSLILRLGTLTRESKQEDCLVSLGEHLIELFKNHELSYSIKNTQLLHTIQQIDLLSTLPKDTKHEFVCTTYESTVAEENAYYEKDRSLITQISKLPPFEKHSLFAFNGVCGCYRKMPWRAQQNTTCAFLYENFFTSREYRDTIHKQFNSSLEECSPREQNNTDWTRGYTLFETLLYLHTYQSCLTFEKGSGQENIDESIATIKKIFSTLPIHIQTFLLLNYPTIGNKYLRKE